MSHPVKVAGARLARAEKHRRQSPSDIADVEVLDARRDYAAERLEDAIRRIVAAAPPLTPEQRDRLAGMLSPFVGAS